MNKKFMKRCFELASKGIGNVAPNPLVGAVIVHENKIIGEGFHTAFGQPHAEVNAIQSVKDKSLFSSSTLFVNLEPCNHFGKTPPCTDLILKYKIPHVVISNNDPNILVSGKGIQKLNDNGVKVEIGILEKEGEFLNRRFFTFHQKKRPYIILKWAQTKDGFLDKIRTNSEAKVNKISSDLSHQLSHQWRTQEMAILVGKNTVINDNPLLTSRLVKGKNPIRIVIDKNLTLPLTKNIFNNDADSIIVNSLRNEKNKNITFLKIENNFTLQNILDKLYQLNIQSIIIEGGKITLEKFINENLWDETRVFNSPILFHNGLSAPKLNRLPNEKLTIDTDELNIYYRL